MKVTLPYILIFLKRGEGSKTPIIVLPHEVEILKEMHGEDAIEITDIEPPIKECTFETEDELSRLEQYYKGSVENSNPTRSVFRNLGEFEAAFATVAGDDEPAKKVKA